MAAVTESDINAPRERNDPTAMWRAVIVNDMRSKIVSE
jgi:hypothetical protein